MENYLFACFSQGSKKILYRNIYFSCFCLVAADNLLKLRVDFGPYVAEKRFLLSFFAA